MSRPGARQRCAIGVDLGGSHVTAAVVREDGIALRAHTQHFDDRSLQHVLGCTMAMIEDALGDVEGSATAIGIGSPGDIDPRSGTIRHAVNLGWRDAQLAGPALARFGLPVFVDNDARCATLAEQSFGIGRGVRNFVLLTLGTGIGAGIVSDGTLLLGDSGSAGEIGHHQIRPSDGFRCACGKIGCFEAQASGTGLVRHARALSRSFPDSVLSDESRETLQPKTISAAAQTGDPHAIAAWDAFADDLALGIANVIAFVDPELIVLGGGVSNAGDHLVASIRKRVDRLTVTVPKGRTKIAIARFRGDSGHIGAGAMALNRAREGRAYAV